MTDVVVNKVAEWGNLLGSDLFTNAYSMLESNKEWQVIFQIGKAKKLTIGMRSNWYKDIFSL